MGSHHSQEQQDPPPPADNTDHIDVGSGATMDIKATKNKNHNINSINEGAGATVNFGLMNLNDVRSNLNTGNIQLVNLNNLNL